MPTLIIRTEGCPMPITPLSLRHAIHNFPLTTTLISISNREIEIIITQLQLNGETGIYIISTNISYFANAVNFVSLGRKKTQNTNKWIALVWLEWGGCRTWWCACGPRPLGTSPPTIWCWPATWAAPERPVASDPAEKRQEAASTEPARRQNTTGGWDTNIDTETCCTLKTHYYRHSVSIVAADAIAKRNS